MSTLTVAEDCQAAIVQTIQDLGLDGIEAREVVPRDQPADWNRFAHRGISVVALKEVELAGTAGSDDYGYPFLIVRSVGTGKGADEEVSAQPQWRHKVRTKFNNKRLPAVPEVFICTVDNGEKLDRRAWEENRSLSTIVVNCWARQRRP